MEINEKSILVVGGYGVVGSQICKMINQKYPEIKIIVGGRNEEKSKKLIKELKNSTYVNTDINDSDPLENLKKTPTALIVAVNDSKDNLLRSAIKRKIPTLDIARWKERIDDAKKLYKEEHSNVPIIMSSGWMASATSIISTAFTPENSVNTQIDIDILLDLNDATGPDSVTNFVDADKPYDIYENNILKKVGGFTEPKKVIFSKDRKFTTRRMSSPEHYSLVEAGVSNGVSVRIAFNSAPLNNFFSLLISTKVWSKLSRKFRKSLLYNEKNKGVANQEFIITLNNNNDFKKISVIDPLGQAHLTAISAFSQAERLLQLNNRVAPKNEISYAEQSKDLTKDLNNYKEFGVSITPLN